MSKGRLEAFSDGVLAIIITIMVLELRPPDGTSLDDLAPLWPHFLAYLLSFANIGIYWNNHHHLFQASRTVDGRVLWANLLLLFSLSLIPFGTAWMGEHEFAAIPVALYGVVLVFAACAYFVLLHALIAAPGQTPALAEAVGRDAKGLLSILAYMVATPLALGLPLVAFGIYVVVAVMWIVPDRRMERSLQASSTVEPGRRP
ncbi:MAG TPA: TMEM175 family protein [Candidatus Limnocylindria bacterium]|nr:TMEM175 family protein [Candidatus Limnocylindria bacterium]